MASPQKEHGFTPIANELLEKITRFSFSSAELKVMLFVLRMTYGYSRKTVNLSYTELAKAVNMQRSNAFRTVKRLKRYRVLSVVTTDNTGKNVFSIRKDYSQWRRSVVRSDNTGVVRSDNTPRSSPPHTPPITSTETSTSTSTAKQEHLCAAAQNEGVGFAANGERRAYRIPDPAQRPGDALVMYYKALKLGVPYDDREWDEKFWARWAGEAKSILRICGTYESAKACIDFIEKQFADKMWNLSTVTKWAWDWRKKFGGRDYGPANRQRFFNALAHQRGTGRSETVGETTEAGAVSPGVGSVHPVQAQRPEAHRRL